MQKLFDVDEVMGQLFVAVSDIMQEDVIAAGTAITLATPVGNPTLWDRPESAPPGYVGGHARRNWAVSIGVPRTEELEGVDASGAQAIGEMTAEARRYGPRDAEDGELVYIQNSVPYIVPLNNGWSTQAPINFVEMAANMVIGDGGSDSRDLP